MLAREWIEAHRRSIIFLMVLLVAGGIGALFRLPTSLFPRTTFPRIVILADAGDRPVKRMVVEVTRPLEEAVRTVPGVRTVRSTTSRGSCEIAITFRWGLDMISATLQVDSAIAQVLPSLPPGIHYEVQRMDPTVFPVMGLSLTSPSTSLVELRDLALGALALRHVGSGFMPRMDEGGFILDYRAPAGTSLAETDRRLRLVETILAKVPEVRSYSRRTGLQLAGSVTEANEGDFFIRLKAMPRRPIEAVMDEVRQRVQQRVPGLAIELAQLIEDLIGDLTAVPQPIEVKLFGASETALQAQAARVVEAIATIPNVVDVNSGVIIAGDALQIHVDRIKAQSLGLDAESITRMAAIAIDGALPTQVRRGDKMIGVRVWVRHDARASIDTLRRLRLRTAEGRNVPLGRIATFTRSTGQAQIVRENLKTMVAVPGRISGRDMGSVIRDVKAKVNGLHLPKKIDVEYGGLYRQQQKSFRGLLAVLAAAVALVFTLLLYMYERFAAPVAILLTDLLAATAVFSGLWWTSTELNISSMMGLTMIIGISSEAAIFYMSQWQELAPRMDFKDALVEAGRLRFRPILITALAAILALLPLALAIGEGAAMLQPLAIAIIAGLIVTVPLTLLVLPVIFTVLARGGGSDEVAA